MSQDHRQAQRVDVERTILVPIFFLLLLINLSVLAHSWSSGDASGPSRLMAASYRILTVSFYVLMVSLLLVRKQAQASTQSWRAKSAAYIGTFSPFLLMLNGGSALGGRMVTWVSLVTMTLGLGFTVYSLTWLGRSFGVVPQARALVTRGPYRFVRHPLYVGEFVTFAGIVIGMPTPFSALVFLFWLPVQAYRAIQEEKVLGEVFPEYDSYKGQTSRFIPRVI